MYQKEKAKIPEPQSFTVLEFFFVRYRKTYVLNKKIERNMKKNDISGKKYSEKRDKCTYVIHV